MTEIQDPIKAWLKEVEYSFECEEQSVIRKLPKLISLIRIYREANQFYASLNMPNGNHACDIDVRFQIEGSKIACVAEKKAKEIVG